MTSSSIAAIVQASRPSLSPAPSSNNVSSESGTSVRNAILTAVANPFDVDVLFANMDNSSAVVGAKASIYKDKLLARIINTSLAIAKEQENRGKVTFPVVFMAIQIVGKIDFGYEAENPGEKTAKALNLPKANSHSDLTIFVLNEINGNPEKYDLISIDPDLQRARAEKEENKNSWVRAIANRFDDGTERVVTILPVDLKRNAELLTDDQADAFARELGFADRFEFATAVRAELSGRILERKRTREAQESAAAETVKQEAVVEYRKTELPKFIAGFVEAHNGTPYNLPENKIEEAITTLGYGSKAKFLEQSGYKDLKEVGKILEEAILKNRVENDLEKLVEQFQDKYKGSLFTIPDDVVSETIRENNYFGMMNEKAFVSYLGFESLGKLKTALIDKVVSKMEAGNAEEATNNRTMKIDGELFDLVFNTHIIHRREGERELATAVDFYEALANYRSENPLAKLLKAPKNSNTRALAARVLQIVNHQKIYFGSGGVAGENLFRSKGVSDDLFDVVYRAHEIASKRPRNKKVNRDDLHSAHSFHTAVETNSSVRVKGIEFDELLDRALVIARNPDVYLYAGDIKEEQKLRLEIKKMEKGSEALINAEYRKMIDNNLYDIVLRVNSVMRRERREAATFNDAIEGLEAFRAVNTTVGLKELGFASEKALLAKILRIANHQDRYTYMKKRPAAKS